MTPVPRILALLSIMFCIQCTPLSLNAPFAADPAQRQQFVNTTVVGTTTLDDLIARWGPPTGGQSMIEGPYQDGLVWNWTTGTLQQGGNVKVIVDSQEIVRVVESSRYANGQKIPDPANGAAAAVQPDSQSPTPTPAQNASASEDEPLFELECLIFCI